MIIKVLAGIIQERLKPVLLKTCYHLKGHGGLKGAIRDVMTQLPKYKFFCKTDVNSYYDSIDHYTLLMKLHDYIDDRVITGYVWQFLNRCVEWGFNFLGYFLKPDKLEVSGETVNRFSKRIARLYEQESPNKIKKRLGQYALRWGRWVSDGLWGGTVSTPRVPRPKESSLCTLLSLTAIITCGPASVTPVRHPPVRTPATGAHAVTTPSTLPRTTLTPSRTNGGPPNVGCDAPQVLSMASMETLCVHM